jgi:conjugal transfer pilus assembly protein TraV
MTTAPRQRGARSASVALCFLAGCANFSGLDGASAYACKAPEGVKCDSVSGTYYNAVQNNLPSQRRAPMGGQPDAPAAPASPSPTALRSTTAMLTTAARAAPSGDVPPYPAAALRASPKVLRLWIKAWEDTDRDLNGESLVYVQIDSGRWLVDHVQRQSREAYAPVRPGMTPAAKSTAATPSSASAGPAQSDDPTSLTQALRALQGRTAAPADR